MKAVILAAGCATRLRPHTDDRPKTLLNVGGVAILRRTITSLLRLGFDQFVIGTGYLEHQVRDAVADWFPGLDVEFVTNPDFRSTNNAYSLSLLRPQVDGHPFILLDGDVVFDDRVVEELLERGPDCLAVRSVGEIGLEEVKVTANAEDRVLAIGKHVPVRSAMGESVGIELFSADTSRRLFEALHRRCHEQGLVNEYYEASFQEIIEQGATLYGVDIGTLYATEIDTYDDLVAANRRLAARPAFDVRVDAFRVAV
ncbi:MAG: phosphocholine cytidylyltransferase family protein [Kofleriaceae bacterium]|nr:phosphocholine cytidylyltransferase family protein [Myxococcales bacterium]MCB9560454.1 phosphocholine cytidylyltransferase family protein [Kofleriaceae bacterium]MCB9571615.1 phosphocholine cytidylyltransferase family protein [Kofleriaceae bacterium]